MRYENVSSDKEKFSLHDCLVRSARLENGHLFFRFPDGIFYKDYSDDWPNTGKAEVEFAIDSDRGVTVYLFLNEKEQTIRKEYTLPELIIKINSKEWILEFAYRYDGYKEVLYKCWIWENRGPCSYECELWISINEDTVFRWDQPVVQPD